MCLWGVTCGEMPSVSKVTSDPCSLASLALPSGGRTSALGKLSVPSCVSGSEVLCKEWSGTEAVWPAALGCSPDQVSLIPL